MERPDSVPSLEAFLAKPSAALVEDMRQLDGDILILGVGGKMGPSLARLAAHALRVAGQGRRVIGVARFSSQEVRDDLEAAGVQTIQANLLEPEEFAALPDVPNVVFMAGQKFGTTGQEAYTWAMNAYLPGRVAERYRNARISAFSTGNVYPCAPIRQGGLLETSEVGPIGEYAGSCLGRERMFEHFSRRYGTTVALLRLSFANDLRYGVLVDIAQQVLAEAPIDLTVGAVSVCWQGDANEIALRSLLHAASPPFVLNLSGPEVAPVRWIAEQFGEFFGKPVDFLGEEGDSAWILNTAKQMRIFGYPSVTLAQMVEWTAAWLLGGGPTLDRPTHYLETDGRY